MDFAGIEPAKSIAIHPLPKRKESSGETTINPFDELMFEDGFVDDVTDTQDDFEGNAVFPHLVIADEGFEAGDAVFAVIQDMAGHAEGDVFDVLQVVVISNG